VGWRENSQVAIVASMLMKIDADTERLKAELDDLGARASPPLLPLSPSVSA
jgi:hypothetical protein